MFGINFSEIILICAVALIVLGPKQLPPLASRIGLIIHSIKNYLACLKQDIYSNSGIGELINTKDELIKTYSSIRKDIMPHNKIENQYISKDHLEVEEIYQPELEFDRQPELFDKPVHEQNR